MDELFENGYLIIALIVFIYSVLKKFFGAKKPAPQKPVRKPLTSAPPITHQAPTPAEMLKRELAEYLGIEEEVVTVKPTYTDSPAKEPEPVPQKLKRKESLIPIQKIVRKQQPVEIIKTPPKTKSVSLRERIIWAEILGPPKSKRRGRTI